MIGIISQIYPEIILFIIIFVLYLIFRYINNEREFAKNINLQNGFNLKEETNKQLQIYEKLKIGDIFTKELFDETFVDVSEISEIEDCKIYSLGFVEYINGDSHNSNRFIKINKNTNKILGKSLSWELFR